MPLLYSLGIYTVKFTKCRYVYCDNSYRKTHFVLVKQDHLIQLTHKKLILTSIFDVPKKIYNIARISVRYIGIILLFCPVLLLYPVSRINYRLNNIWWSIVLNSLNLSGPVFIKLGQWASTRRDLFSSEICDKLSVLQRHTNSHPWCFTARQLKESFGDGWNDIFSFESKVPVGSGCVAQVYKAEMKCNNIPVNILEKIEIPNSKDSIFSSLKAYFHKENKEETFIKDEKVVPVAIKVLHPNIHKRFHEDLLLFKSLAQLVEFVLPFLKWLDLNGCVKEFSHFMINQMDLEQEGRMLDKFSKNFQGISSVKFPQPVWPYVKREVLVETWE
ncbi:uncharacterized aarF domain-containing protein kinase 2-like, partial [Centruroides sculpturatus]|uniref:uncharacterized aarF domain-containing protein kinase 2-like n=1 Tax=Centruroides sculpturatus TaxID=218467 RepID=UPI000C6DD7FE